MSSTVAPVVSSVGTTAIRHLRAKRKAPRIAATAAATATSASSTPAVSVLVPAWNHVGYLGECLGSIVNQDYENLELVVVDDCSTDGSLELARELARTDGRVSVTRNDENLGAFRNSVRCLEVASNRLVMFVGADDVLKPGAIRALVAAMTRHPSAALSFGRFDEMDEAGSVLDVRGPMWWEQSEGELWAGRDAASEMLRRCRNLIGSPTAVLFDNEALDDHGALPGGRPGRQPLFDFLWWIRVLAVGDVAHVDAVVSDRRVHRSSTSNSLGAHARLVEAWEGMLLEGIRLGHLPEPELEKEAWSSFLLLAAGLMARPGRWRGSSPFLPGVFGSAQRACRRIAALDGRVPRPARHHRDGAVA